MSWKRTSEQTERADKRHCCPVDKGPFLRPRTPNICILEKKSTQTMHSVHLTRIHMDPAMTSRGRDGDLSLLNPQQAPSQPHAQHLHRHLVQLKSCTGRGSFPIIILRAFSSPWVSTAQIWVSRKSCSKSEPSPRSNQAEGNQIRSQVSFLPFSFSDKNTDFLQERMGAVLLKTMVLFLDFSYILPFPRQFNLTFGQKFAKP